MCDLLDDPAARARLGASARRFAVANYDLKTVCLPRQLEWVTKLGNVSLLSPPVISGDDTIH